MPREIGIHVHVHVHVHVSAFLLATWRHRLGEVALVETSLQSCLGSDFCGRKSADGDESARETHPLWICGESSVARADSSPGQQLLTLLYASLVNLRALERLL